MIVHITRVVLFLMVACTATAQPLKIIASIYPVQLIAQEVVGDRHALEVLLSAGQSPHDFAFKVSERRKLADADLLLWVGPELEPYLASIAANKSSLAMVSALSPDPSVTELDSDNPLEGESSVESHGDFSHGHDHHRDQHLWLSIEDTRQFTMAIAQRLAQLDPEGGDIYRDNARAFVAQLALLHEVYQKLTGTQSDSRQPRPYAVAHRAYGHFLESFPFPEPVVLTNSPELSPGARSLWQIGNKLDSDSCLLVEGRNPQRWLTSFAERNQLRLVSIDIMGDLSGVNTYIELVTTMLEVFSDCSQLDRGNTGVGEI